MWLSRVDTGQWYHAHNRDLVPILCIYNLNMEHLPARAIWRIIIAILHHGMKSYRVNRLLLECWSHALICDVTHISSLSLQYHYASMQMNAMPIDSMLRNDKNNINLMLFNEIDNFIEVYNNSVIELVQCFGISCFGRIDHLASSVITFRPKNSVPKTLYSFNNMNNL